MVHGASSLRVASLLPAGTEIVVACGAEHLLVGISHQCDYPGRITGLPRLTWSPIRGEGSNGEIDAQVRALARAGRPVIEVDGEKLAALRPDLIVIQELCEVCAVTDGGVRAMAQAVQPVPTLLPLRGRTLDGVLGDIRAVGSALGRQAEAAELVSGLEARLQRLRAEAVDPPPRVVCVEWLDPLYLAGHWVPELVEAAGGRDAGPRAGAPSSRCSWEDLVALEPDLVVVMLCGFGLERTQVEWRALLAARPGVADLIGRRRRPIWAIDGNAYTSRPGPRLVDGARLIQRAIRGESGSDLARLA